MSAKERFKDPPGFLPGICFVLELLGVILIAAQHSSICIQAHEISKYTHIFLLLTYAFVIPDLLMFALTCLTNKVSIRPFGMIYHGIASVVCFAAAVALCMGLTFCGNSAQIFFTIGAACGLISTILHLLTMIAIKRRLQT